MRASLWDRKSRNCPSRTVCRSFVRLSTQKKMTGEEELRPWRSGMLEFFFFLSLVQALGLVVRQILQLRVRRPLQSHASFLKLPALLTSGG